MSQVSRIVRTVATVVVGVLIGMPVAWVAAVAIVVLALDEIFDAAEGMGQRLGLKLARKED